MWTGKSRLIREEQTRGGNGGVEGQREKKRVKWTQKCARGIVDLFLEGGSHRHARHNDDAAATAAVDDDDVDEDDDNDADDDGSSGFQANKKITPPHETRRRIKRR